MLPELLQKSNLFSFLYQADIELAQQCRENACPHCGARLHQANYPRTPWNAPKNTPDEQKIRQSLCCGREGCRKRLLPPSCIYMGRKKYWSGVIVIVTALRQNKSKSPDVIKLMRMFNISYKTVLSWRDWFRDIFPSTPQWKRLRGRISPHICSHQLPGNLLDYFIQSKGSAEAGLIGCLQFFASG